MRRDKKTMVLDLLVLLIPVVIVMAVMDALPTMIVITSGLSFDKKFIFPLAFVPFLILKVVQSRK